MCSFVKTEQGTLKMCSIFKPVKRISKPEWSTPWNRKGLKIRITNFTACTCKKVIEAMEKTIQSSFPPSPKL